MKNDEYVLQCQVVQWLRWQYPDVRFNADCGGVRYGAGLQAILRGKRMKAMGHSAGFPDLFICKPYRGLEILYCGLFIEFKSLKGKITPEQTEWLHYLDDNGYQTAVCNTYEKAIAVIKEYLA